eukprot:Amastigsp_a346820_9.p3 type:complete len:144 gc:universal Amastigsp_a346820_9:729-298(-)
MALRWRSGAQRSRSEAAAPQSWRARLHDARPARARFCRVPTWGQRANAHAGDARSCCPWRTTRCPRRHEQTKKGWLPCRHRGARGKRATSVARCEGSRACARHHSRNSAASSPRGRFPRAIAIADKGRGSRAEAGGSGATRAR